MKKVKYVGQENGLYIGSSPVGDHFVKGEEKEVTDVVYDSLFERYLTEFEFLSGIPKSPELPKELAKKDDNKGKSRKSKKKGKKGK